MQEVADEDLQEKALNALALGDMEQVFALLQSELVNAPFSLAIRTIVIEAVNRIIAIEERRGEIPRSARSALAPEAQPYQDLIDKLFYKMAGLTAEEVIALEERLEKML